MTVQELGNQGISIQLLRCHYADVIACSLILLAAEVDVIESAAAVVLGIADTWQRLLLILCVAAASLLARGACLMRSSAPCKTKT
jgi:hypothetical protein